MASEAVTCMSCLGTPHELPAGNSVPVAVLGGTRHAVFTWHGYDGVLQVILACMLNEDGSLRRADYRWCRSCGSPHERHIVVHDDLIHVAWMDAETEEWRARCQK